MLSLWYSFKSSSLHHHTCIQYITKQMLNLVHWNEALNWTTHLYNQLNTVYRSFAQWSITYVFRDLPRCFSRFYFVLNSVAYRVSCCMLLTSYFGQIAGYWETMRFRISDVYSSHLVTSSFTSCEYERRSDPFKLTIPLSYSLNFHF